MGDSTSEATVGLPCAEATICGTTIAGEGNEPSLMERNLAQYGSGLFDWVSAYLLIVALVGISANALILIIYPKKKSLRSPINLLFVNLAISDLLVGLFGSFTQFLTTTMRVEAIPDTALCNGYGFSVFLAGK